MCCGAKGGMSGVSRPTSVYDVGRAVISSSSGADGQKETAEECGARSSECGIWETEPFLFHLFSPLFGIFAFFRLSVGAGGDANLFKDIGADAQAYSRVSEAVLKANQAYSSLIKGNQGYLKKYFYEVFGNRRGRGHAKAWTPYATRANAEPCLSHSGGHRHSGEMQSKRRNGRRLYRFVPLNIALYRLAVGGAGRGVSVCRRFVDSESQAPLGATYL
jgi:hypothetical protein